LALLGPAVGVTLLMAACGANFEAIYRDLGVQLPGITEMTMGAMRMVVTAVVLTIVVAASTATLRAMAGLWILGCLWCFDVERERALLRLLQAARIGDQSTTELGPAQLALSVLRLGLVRPGRPAWETDWLMWMEMSRHRLDPEQQRTIAGMAELATRLTALRLVDLVDGRPDWDDAEERCRHRLAAAVADGLLFVRPVLLALGWLSVATVGLGAVLPLLWLVQGLGRMW
jgi:hypothetical protein